MQCFDCSEATKQYKRLSFQSSENDLNHLIYCILPALCRHASPCSVVELLALNQCIWFSATLILRPRSCYRPNSSLPLLWVPAPLISSSNFTRPRSSLASPQISGEDLKSGRASPLSIDFSRSFGDILASPV